MYFTVDFDELTQKCTQSGVRDLNSFSRQLLVVIKPGAAKQLTVKSVKIAKMVFMVTMFLIIISCNTRKVLIGEINCVILVLDRLFTFLMILLSNYDRTKHIHF